MITVMSTVAVVISSAVGKGQHKGTAAVWSRRGAELIRGRWWLVQVKEYLERQWHKILANRVSVQDFVFAKEVRLGTYSPRAAVVPPAAIVAAKAMATDPRAEPRFAERVPYVVVYGEPGSADPSLGCMTTSLICFGNKAALVIYSEEKNTV